MSVLGELVLLTRNATHIQGAFGQSWGRRWWADLVIVYCIHVELDNILPLDYCSKAAQKLLYLRPFLNDGGPGTSPETYLIFCETFHRIKKLLVSP